MSDDPDRPDPDRPDPYVPASARPGDVSPGAPLPAMRPVPASSTVGAGAGLGRRFLAKFVDALVVGIPLAGLRTLTGVEADSELGAVVQAVAFLVYASLLESSTGATLGKRVLHLTVRTDTGEPPGLRAALVRNLYWAFQIVPPAIVGSVLSLVAWLGISVSIAAMEQHRGFHDRAAGTMVVRTA